MTSAPNEAALSALLAEAQSARARNAPQEALGILTRARSQFGDHDRILFALAIVFSDVGMHGGAITLYQQLRARRPDDFMLLNNLAGAFDAAGRQDEGLAAIDLAMHLAPQEAALVLTKALLEHHKGDLDAAEKTLRRALEINPASGEAWLNLAEVLTDKGNLEATLACQERALAQLGPKALLRFNMAHTLFKLGRLKDAWALYEARFEADEGQRPRVRPRITSLPRWRGEELKGGKLLLWMEQGVGEEILYASLLPDVAKRQPNMVIECAPRLVPLFARSFPALAFEGRREDAAENDVAKNNDARFAAHVPAASLGGYFRNSADAFPAHQGYLKADGELRDILRESYKALGNGPIIGLSWRSVPRRFGDPKSITPQTFASALKSISATFISLQYGDVEDDIHAMREAGLDVHVDGAINPLHSLDAFAAQVAACDAVLTVSNTTAHMAGALNVPASVLVPSGTAAPHHWFYGQAQSPWYPSLQLFWQESQGKWDRPLAAAARWLTKTAQKT